MIRAVVMQDVILQDNPSATMANISVIGPPLAECLKDGNTPVRLAAERCALHVFQLTKGIESVELLSVFYAHNMLAKFRCSCFYSNRVTYY